MTEPNPWTDPRTWIALGLVVVMYLFWEQYQRDKYKAYYTYLEQRQSAPTATNDKPTAAALGQTSTAGSLGNGSVSETTASDQETLAPEPAPKAIALEPGMVLDNPTWRLEIVPEGMGLKNIRLKQYVDRDGKAVVLGASAGTATLATFIDGQDALPIFKLRQINSTTVVGEAQSEGIYLVKKYKFDPATYSVEVDLRMQGTRLLGVGHILKDRLPAAESASMFAPSFEHPELYVETYEGETQRESEFGSDYDRTTELVKTVSIGSQYFATAVTNRSSIRPAARSVVKGTDGSVAEIRLLHRPPNLVNNLALEYQAFLGPKDTRIVEKLDAPLAGIINFGWFNGIGQIMLKVLRWFYEVTGNWGWAIVLLTITVRMVLLVPSIWSFKSMKAMQKLQPLMQDLREKYADDKARQQQEMMKLFKEHKVNPFGSCLPMLLQFPVFIALYRVLAQSIELYHAPFALWIHDLSMKDPFYVLPILMGLVMFTQQKITPTTMDPAQARVMMMMPIIFSFFMIALPSGLTLYMFVSGVFGLVQHVVFMRDRTESINLVATNASA